MHTISVHPHSSPAFLNGLMQPLLPQWTFGTNAHAPAPDIITLRFFLNICGSVDIHTNYFQVMPLPYSPVSIPCNLSSYLLYSIFRSIGHNSTNRLGILDFAVKNHLLQLTHRIRLHIDKFILIQMLYTRL